MRSVNRTVVYTALLLFCLIALGCAISHGHRPCEEGVGIPSSVSAVSQMASDSGLNGLYRMRPGRSRLASSADPNWQGGNDDSRSIQPGETLTLADLQGPGVARHIWTTSESAEIWHMRKVVVRMYWDDEKEPSVECPLGDFFGEAHGVKTALRSLPVYVDGNGTGRNCFWPMPFRKSARITVTNEGERQVNLFFWQIDWEEVPAIPVDAGYFHCQYRQEYPTVSGRNYQAADIEGRGHYVGTVFALRQMKGGWWGEGDHFFYLDGETEPSLRGTGNEDYFGDAWGLQLEEGMFCGAPLVEGRGIGERTTAYRWHLLDPIRFNESLRMEFEIKDGAGDRSEDVSSVAYWYQEEPHKPFAPLPSASERIYPLIMFEGEDLRLAGGAKDDSVFVDEDPKAAAGAYLRWAPASAGGELKLEIPVETKGLYEAYFGFVYGPDHGVFDVLLRDTYYQRARSLHRGGRQYHSFDGVTLDLEAGPNTITIKNQGKPGKTKKTAFGIDWVALYKKS
jgi:hypothetical protein